MMIAWLLTTNFLESSQISQSATAISYVNVNSAGSTISNPGIYYLTGNVSFYPTTDPTISTIIHVTTSNVTINLNANTISQASTNSTLDLNAIVIDPDVHHVTIQNGTISGVSGVGVVIGEGCTDITIKNMQMTNCVQGGLTATGTSSSLIFSLTLQNLLLSKNNGDPSAYGDSTNTYSPLGMKIVNAAHFDISSCECIANQTETNDTAYGLYLQQCSNGIISNSAFSGNQSNEAVYGVLMEQCVALEINNSKFVRNVSLAYNAYGCALIGSDDNKIYKSQSLSNSGNALTYGFFLQGFEDSTPTYYGSNDNSIIECSSSANATVLGNCYGYFSSGNAANNFIQSRAQGNRSGTTSGSIAAGFYAEQLTEYTTTYNETLTNVNKCVSKANYSQDSNGIGAGILINTVLRGNIEGNWVLSNTGVLSSYGIVDLTAESSSLIMSNYAFGHTTNYLATYEDPNDAIPVISGTVGDFTTLANVTPFVNYEWRNNCGCYTTT